MKILNPHWTIKGFNSYGEEVAKFERSSVEEPTNESITEFVNEHKGITRVEIEKSFHVYSDVVHEGEPKLLRE